MSSTKTNGSKQRKKWGNDIALLDKLREIREKSGLSQEDFFKEHLSDIARGNLNSDSSFQGFMKQLENDERPITPAILKRYAEIEKCSVDDLLNFDVEKSKRKALTFRDVARMLVEIDEGFHFVTNSKLYPSNMAIDPTDGTAYYDEKSVLYHNYVTFGLLPDPANYGICHIERDDLTGENISVVETMPGHTDGYIKLNEFLHKYISWKGGNDEKDASVKKEMDQAEWRALINKAMEKIPEDRAPYPLDTWEDFEPWIPEDLQEHSNPISEEAASENGPSSGEKDHSKESQKES